MSVPAVSPPSLPLSPPFDRYDLQGAFDEMFTDAGDPRAHYRALVARLREIPIPELQRHQQAADRAFLTQGITFTVYGDGQGTERIFPYDLLPRIVPATEWEHLERGLQQRLHALNLFLRDIYHEGKILSAGIVPADLVYSCPHYRRDMRGGGGGGAGSRS